MEDYVQHNLSQQDTYGWCSVMGYNSHINMQSNPSDETKYSMYCMDVRSSAYTIEFREDSILQNVKKKKCFHCYYLLKLIFVVKCYLKI